MPEPTMAISDLNVVTTITSQIQQLTLE
jgi:hypothetical protein